MMQSVRTKDQFVPLVASWFGLFFLGSLVLFSGPHLMVYVGGSAVLAIAASMATVLIVKEMDARRMKTIWIGSLALNVGLAVFQFSRIYRMLQG
jgi:hypothetical protein